MMDVEYGSPAARNAYRMGIHLTLIVGSLIFSMPFVWMVSCSLKEDDEQMTEKLVWFPRLPPYQPRSPFVDAREGKELIRPEEVPPARWVRLEPAIAGVLEAALQSVPLDMGATPPQEAQALVREALWRDVAQKIPSEKLRDEAGLREEIAQIWENTARPYITSEALKDEARLKADLAALSQRAAQQVPPGPFKDPAAVSAMLAQAWPELAAGIPADKFRNEEALTMELRSRAREMARRVGTDLFKPEEERTKDLAEAVAKLAAQPQVGESHHRLYRALAVGDITLRAEGKSDVRVPVRAGGKRDGELVWRVAPSSPGAELALKQTVYNNKAEEEVRYAFGATGERVCVRAVAPFESKEPPKAINIGLKSDASWNRVWFAIELNGKRYEAVEPSPLAGMGRMFGEVMYQLPSPEDEDDLRIRHWLITHEVTAAGAHNQPGTVKIELAVENTSFATKVYDKATYNYRNALRYIPFWRYFLTSVFLVVINIALAVFSSSLIAYAFARLSWPGRNICWAILLGTIMIPGQVTMIPNFLIMKWLGWYNTLRPMWVGAAFGSVFFIFMLRQFMKNIPKDLEDAAKIDGCSYWQIYWHVILPLVKPTLAAIGIFTFMGVWNDFMGPLMYLSDQRSYPLSLGLFAFQTIAGGNQGMMMAASLMMTLPVIALFFVAQKQFIQGVTFTGIKG